MIAGRCQPMVRRVASRMRRISAPPSASSSARRPGRPDLVVLDVERQIERCRHRCRRENPIDDPGGSRVEREGPSQRVEQEDQDQRQRQERGPVERRVDRELRPEQRIGRQRESESAGQPAEPALRPVGGPTLAVDRQTFELFRGERSAIPPGRSPPCSELHALRRDRTPSLPGGAAPLSSPPRRRASACGPRGGSP